MRMQKQTPQRGKLGSNGSEGISATLVRVAGGGGRGIINIYEAALYSPPARLGGAYLGGNVVNEKIVIELETAKDPRIEHKAAQALRESYRGTSRIRGSPPTKGFHRALGIVLL